MPQAAGDMGETVVFPVPGDRLIDELHSPSKAPEAEAHTRNQFCDRHLTLGHKKYFPSMATVVRRRFTLMLNPAPAMALEKRPAGAHKHGDMVPPFTRRVSTVMHYLHGRKVDQPTHIRQPQ